jgi:hypothetical protein
VLNRSNTNQTWFCPVVKDNGNDFLGSITVFNGPYPITTLRCTMISSTRDGYIRFGSTRGTAYALAELSFSRLDAAANHHAYITCDVPDLSGIHSYQIDEVE